jgi:hypothetical protein
VHARWLLPWLRAIATAITVAAVRRDSSSAAHCKASRLDTRPAGRRASSPRGCRRWRREHRIAGGEPARILSRGGISSPDTSRVNPVSSAASSGSEPASRSVIESRACCSRALRLIAGPPATWRCPDPQKRHEEAGGTWLRGLASRPGAHGGDWPPSDPARARAKPRNRGARGALRRPRQDAYLHKGPPPCVRGVHHADIGRGHQPVMGIPHPARASVRDALRIPGRCRTLAGDHDQRDSGRSLATPTRPGRAVRR